MKPLCSYIVMVLLFLAFTKAEVTRTNTHKCATFMMAYTEKILETSQYERHSVLKTIECARYCIRNSACKSFNLWVDDTPMTCDLLFKDRFDSVTFRNEPGTRYYDAAPIYPNCKLAVASNGHSAGMYFLQADSGDSVRQVECTAGGKRVYSNCKDTLLNNENLKGEYAIKPDENNESFVVFCKKDGDDFITEVAHDWLSKHISGREACPGGQIPIVYTGVNDINPLITLVDASDSCSQSARVQCRNAQVYLDENDRTQSCIGAAGRDLNHIGYWAGGSHNNYCACAVTGNCVSSSKECNCESTTSTISYVDAGTYTDKTLLPLRAIYAGDTGSTSEYLDFEIGKLICRVK